jgi:DNA-binding MarR family transcriptional regulator
MTIKKMIKEAKNIGFAFGTPEKAKLYAMLYKEGFFESVETQNKLKLSPSDYYRFSKYMIDAGYCTTGRGKSRNERTMTITPKGRKVFEFVTGL